MLIINTEAAPVNSSITVNYPLEWVKKCIEELLKDYSQYFVVVKNGNNSELNTYVFSRPKGIDTPIIRITLAQIEDFKTQIDINASSQSFTVTPPDLQLAITEILNILVAKLKGSTGDKLEKILKKNNSGNGTWGCLKTIGCGAILLFIVFFFGLVFIRFVLEFF